MDLGIERTEFQPIEKVEIPEIFYNRLKTGNDVLDSMFGAENAGILPGATITLKSKPGTGKSVFSLSLGEQLSLSGYNVAYATGEEDVRQVAYNCKRLGVCKLPVGVKTDVDELAGVMKDHDFMVIDSFQTLTTKDDLTRDKKTKYCIDNLVSQAKLHSCSLLFIVQETASGDMKGGPMLSFASDVNMEIRKDPDDPNRRLIDFHKNRFGPCGIYTAEFTSTGYNFIGEYINETNMNEKTKKVSVKEPRKNKIMEFEGLITMNRVMDELEVSDQTARILLVELENEMKLLKYGRGESAIWKRI